MDLGIQELLRDASSLFTAPLFQMGETPVSLSAICQLIVALLIVVVLTGIFNNFLKRRLLFRLGIDEGNREAIATIISYAVGTLCFVVVLQSTNFNLASLVVLAGGLGVGIGFGLQDATKNFVSGVNLLLERKIKVGDFVEFDGLSGYIKEIAIRSTLIRTKDGGDLVVLNSKLVETRLLNWSYDNFTARIHILVKVAYESDPVLVTETLLKSAYMESAVLQEPAPEVIFKEFGDNSLNFELWVWVNRIDREPQIKNSLNFIIEYHLRQQKISISFPQMEVSVRNPEVFIQSLFPQTNTQNIVGVEQRPSTGQPSNLLTLQNLLR